MLEDRTAPAVLVAAYAFNEGAGTTVADASGNGNNGTLSNATWTTAGKFGSALSFNGTNARVNVPDAASLHLTTGMTLEAWVNPSSVTAAWRDVIYKGDDNYYLSGTSKSGSKPVVGGVVSGSHLEAYGTSALKANTWTFLAGTFDGSTMRLYVNGVQVASAARSGSLGTSSNPLQIGGDSIYGQYFKGLIDEVRVYNVALTQAQIQADMNSPLSSAPGAQLAAASNLTTTAAGASRAVSGPTGLAGNVIMPDGPSLGLSTEMTLEALVNPSATGIVWRDKIDHGSDDHHLSASPPQAEVPTPGTVFTEKPLFGTASSNLRRLQKVRVQVPKPSLDGPLTEGRPAAPPQPVSAQGIDFLLSQILPEDGSLLLKRTK